MIRTARGLALVAILALPGGIPGVPENCCGWKDCRPAAVRILKVEGGMALVRVNGKTITIPAGYAQRSKVGGYFCFLLHRPECWDGKNFTVSAACARCVIEGGGFANDVRITVSGQRHLIVPVREDCGECHGG